MAYVVLQHLASAHHLTHLLPLPPFHDPHKLFSVFECAYLSWPQDVALSESFPQIFLFLAPSKDRTHVWSLLRGMAERSISHCFFNRVLFITFLAETCLFIHLFTCLSSVSTTAPQAACSMRAELGRSLPPKFSQSAVEQCQSQCRFSVNPYLRVHCETPRGVLECLHFPKLSENTFLTEWQDV